jgi:cytoskeletal protein RodZ
MPEENNQSAQSQSPFEVVTSAKKKKIGGTGVIIGVAVVVLLGLGIFFGVRLVQQNQEIREKAEIASCPGAEACPAPEQPNLLRNCTPPEVDNSPSESLCNTVGRIESCGGVEYCCPTVGGTWTTNMTACAASPTPTATTTATPTATATSTASASPTIAPLVNQSATPTSSATATSTTKSASLTPTPTIAPIPQTGTSWPTIMGAGLGILVIVGAVILAL